ncbi:hypothetical protein BC938DRAFT_483299 [Jimgerdemannia flammicorona]|uniref:t-SNARE coiled-coil homology domain-containing protein n=1 Tax=Jimgerdemannia flammicorona TaxID=994334 RepID=A0A433QC98_9FUNG|nr:hypothetical protein BC938DRAFT_483299 [Jimgerdemannia flammicorona]
MWNERNGTPSSSARANLFGGGSAPSARQLEQNDNLIYEQQNDVRLQELDDKVAALKNITIDIHREVTDQHRLLDESETSFSSFGAGLTTSFTRLNRMVSTRHKRQLCVYVGVAVAVFLVLYWLGNWATNGPSSPKNQ